MKKAFLYEGVNCHTRTDHNCREQLSSVTREHGWPSLPVDQTLWCSNFDLPKSILFLSFHFTSFANTLVKWWSLYYPAIN